MKSLTSKQVLFAKHYASGKSGKESARLAGYSNTEFATAHNLRDSRVLDKIESIFDKVGLSDEKIAKKLKKAIDSGLGKNATNKDAISGLKAIMNVKAKLAAIEQPKTANQTNIMIGKSNDEVMEYIRKVTNETQEMLAQINELKKNQNGDDSNNLESHILKDQFQPL